MNPKFSIVTACWYDKEHPDNARQPRYELFLRCINSVLSQTFEDFEWIIVDDICTPSVEEVVGKKDKRIKVIRLPEKGGRIIAINEAMKHAKGEWIARLDADDEYSSIYLQALDDASRLYPDYDMFSMNHLIFHYDYNVDVRKFIDVEKLEGRPFGSGTIGAGAYAFKKSLYEKVGSLPEKGLWDLADWAFNQYPEVKPFFWNEDKKAYNSLGNPWGDDWLYFYMLTRQGKCKHLNTALYYVHSHYGERFKEDPDYNMGEEKAPSYNPNNR